MTAPEIGNGLVVAAFKLHPQSRQLIGDVLLSDTDGFGERFSVDRDDLVCCFAHRQPRLNIALQRFVKRYGAPGQSWQVDKMSQCKIK
jgi:hypothetical protein